MGRDFLRDLRFGARTLARRPGFTFTAVAVLGLGIGAPTTVLTLIQRIFFETPPEVQEPHRLLRVYRSWAPGQGGGSLGHADYLHYKQSVTTLAGLAAQGGRFVGVFTAGGSETDQLTGTFVSDDYFQVLGVRPALGRFFTPEENLTPGTHAVAVLSGGFWRRAFGADPTVVGRSISINGTSFTVVGVSPDAFRGISPVDAAPDVWFPIAMYGALTGPGDTAWWERLPQSRSNWLTVVGRLAPGVTFEAAEANLTALSAALTYPGRGEGEGLLVARQVLYSPGQATTLSNLSRLLLGVVGLVLLIAVANAAVLLLSRALTRSREMSVRTALGADRGRLFRQLLAESLLVGLAGGGVGLALSWAFSDTAASLLPYRFAGDFRPDLRVVGAATLLSLLVSLAAGLAPALHVARRGSAATAAEGRVVSTRSRARDSLVAAQVALSLILASGAVLFARSFHAARTLDLGFASEDRLVVQVDLRAQGYSADQGRRFATSALERLRGLPGVESAATTAMVPFQGDWSTEIDPPPGHVPTSENGKVFVGMNVVSPGYFELMGMPVRGRTFLESDDGGSTPVVILNESLARVFFPDRDAVGQELPAPDGITYTVAGVTPNATYYALGEEPTHQLYRPVLQYGFPRIHFVVRTRGDAAAMAPTVQAALREIDPALAFPWVSTLEAVVSDQTARYRVTAWLVGLFGALALVLAAAGLYAVVSFRVTQRTREIGVRMALGAPRGRVAREVLRASFALAGVGLAAGLIGVFALRRLTAPLLFQGVAPQDVWAPLGACTILAAVVAAASMGPARRATRVDPLEAIRTD